MTVDIRVCWAFLEGFHRLMSGNKEPDKDMWITVKTVYEKKTYFQERKQAGTGERSVAPMTAMQNRAFMSCGMGCLAYLHTVSFLGHGVLHVI